MDIEYLDPMPAQTEAELSSRYVACRDRLWPALPTRFAPELEPAVEPAVELKPWNTPVLIELIDLPPYPFTARGRQPFDDDFVQSDSPREQIRAIMSAAADFYGVRKADLSSKRRTKDVVLPRQVAMYLCRTMTTRSLPEIGRRFGGRDHTTCLHAYRKIAQLTQSCPELAFDVEAVRALAMRRNSSLRIVDDIAESGCG